MRATAQINEGAAAIHSGGGGGDLFVQDADFELVVLR